MVVGLVEPVTPDVPPIMAPLPLLVEPGAPIIELVLPAVSLLGVPGVALLLEVDVSPPGAGAGVVVDELEDEVVGAGVVSSRLVQAPSETAAMSASAAHEVRDAFIGKLLEGVVRKVSGAVTAALSAL